MPLPTQTNSAVLLLIERSNLLSRELKKTLTEKLDSLGADQLATLKNMLLGEGKVIGEMLGESIRTVVSSGNAVSLAYMDRDLQTVNRTLNQGIEREETKEEQKNTESLFDTLP
ncbi:MAG: hypothetical protein V1926_00265 [Candidatus Peregrinibacteria bacterium]